MSNAVSIEIVAFPGGELFRASLRFIFVLPAVSSCVSILMLKRRFQIDEDFPHRFLRCSLQRHRTVSKFQKRKKRGKKEKRKRKKKGQRRRKKKSTTRFQLSGAEAARLFGTGTEKGGGGGGAGRRWRGRERGREGKHLKAASSTIDRRLSRSGGPGRDTTPSRAISPAKEVPKRLRRARYVAPTQRCWRQSAPLSIRPQQSTVININKLTAAGGREAGGVGGAGGGEGGGGLLRSVQPMNCIWICRQLLTVDVNIFLS